MNALKLCYSLQLLFPTLQKATMRRKAATKNKVLPLLGDKSQSQFATGVIIIDVTGITRTVVNKWRQRFRLQGIKALHDAPRSGNLL